MTEGIADPAGNAAPAHLPDGGRKRPPHVQYALELLASRHVDIGQRERAAVRRAIRPETETAALPFIAPRLGELPPRQRIGAARTFGMIASFGSIGHEQSGKNGDDRWVNRRFGAVLGRTFGKNDAMGVRLTMLPDLDVEVAAEVVAGLLDRLDHERGSAIDWIDLLETLMYWSPTSDQASQPVFDFYSN